MESENERRKRLYGLRTDALILHCPGPLRRPATRNGRDWQRAVDRFFGQEAITTECCDDPDLTIITYNTAGELSLLERCAQHLGLRQLVVLGRGLTGWRWEYKVELVAQFLRSVRVTDYVMCLDAYDVLMVCQPGTILDRFRRMSADILFSSTAWDWPASNECCEFENAVALDAPPAHRHLNAGAYIGRTEAVKRYVEEIDEAIRLRAPWGWTRRGFDDQLAWRVMHRRYYPSIAVDKHCMIFARFDEHR